MNNPDKREILGTLLGKLTNREWEIMRFLATHHTQTNPAAQELHISPETLKAFLKSIYRKLGIEPWGKFDSRVRMTYLYHLWLGNLDPKEWPL